MSISLDIEFDDEGTTMKDFITEEESDLHVQDVSDRKAEIMKKYMDTLKEPYRTQHRRCPSVRCRIKL